MRHCWMRHYFSKVDYWVGQSTQGDGRLHLYARQGGRVRQEKQRALIHKRCLGVSREKPTFRGSSFDGGVGR